MRDDKKGCILKFYFIIYIHMVCYIYYMYICNDMNFFCNDKHACVVFLKKSTSYNILEVNKLKLIRFHRKLIYKVDVLPYKLLLPDHICCITLHSIKKIHIHVKEWFFTKLKPPRAWNESSSSIYNSKWYKWYLYIRNTILYMIYVLYDINGNYNLLNEQSNLILYRKV